MASPAMPSSFSGAWLTNAQQDSVIGYPDTPEWPGAITSDHADKGPADPGRSGPPSGTAPQGFASQVPALDLSGGMITDTAAGLGHSAPVAAFDSSSGDPFAPPGPIADTHGDDTGGTGRKEHVPAPRSPGWWRRTDTGQAMNRTVTYDPAGKMITEPAGRDNLDQYQGQNAEGYDPRVIPYSERPLKANYAAEAYPIQEQPGGYFPDGALPDMAQMGGQGSWVYSSPPDPYAAAQAPAAATAGYQPSLGMEYVGG